jgi:hypothetical protein
MKPTTNTNYRALSASLASWTLSGLLLLSSNLALAANPPIDGVLRKSTINGRYFTNNSGKAIYLTGSHTWNNFIDGGFSTPDGLGGADWFNCGTFDFTAYLNWMQRHNHNFIRLWTPENFKDVGSGGQIVTPTLYLPATGPTPSPTPPDGLPFFDLTKFNPDYFARLRQHVIEAGNKGIYVSIMLFNAWGISIYENADAWQGHPYHSGNNVNGIAPPNEPHPFYGHPWGGYCQRWRELSTVTCENITDPTKITDPVTKLQRDYVLKVIDTVKDLDNVLYEIDNEGHVESAEWQKKMVCLIQKTEDANVLAGSGKKHPVGMTAYWGQPIDFQNNTAEWIAPSNADISGDYSLDPPQRNDPSPCNVTVDRVYVLDTDHLSSTNVADHNWVWKGFTRGYNSIYMDQLPQVGGATNTGFLPPTEDGRLAMGDAKSYADKMQLTGPTLCQSATPHQELYLTDPSHGYVLANPGSEYLVYKQGNGSFQLNLAAGTYNVEWFNATTHQTVPPQSPTVTHSGGARTFTPPSGFSAGQDVVLYLKVGAISTPAPTPTPTPIPAYTFYRGINLGTNAPAKTIQDINGQARTWLSHNAAVADALPFSLTMGAPYTIQMPWNQFSPPVNADTNDMLHDGIWRDHTFNPPDMSFRQALPNGHYGVVFWTAEPYQPFYRSSDVKMEGTLVAAAIANQDKDHWTKYGPYDITVCDGNLDVTFQRLTGDAGLEGLEIYRRNLTLTSAVSRMTHDFNGPSNPALTFDLPLPLTNPYGIECRSTSGNLKLVFTFSNVVVSGTAAVTSGTGTVSPNSAFANNTMTVNVTGVTNLQWLTITLQGVTDNMNQVLPNTQVVIGLLRGDVSGSATGGNGVVNASDVSTVSGQSGKVAGATNFQDDLNVSGLINASDVSLARGGSGTGLPPSPP